ncbi:MAG: S41 family peptidase [Pseudomonadota bacterium]
MRIIVLIALLSAFPNAFAIGPPAKPADAGGWSALTVADVEAIHALLRDNTPIPFDTENPAYSRWLEAGRDEAKLRAAEVTSEAGYVYTLTAYALGFRDPHINVKVHQPRIAGWPGFVGVARGDEVIVAQRDTSDPDAPALGARIESCDGQNPAALVQSRMSPFSGTAGVPERWSVPDLFLDFQNPFVPLPESCLVRMGGEVLDINLRWRKVSGVSPTFGADLSAAVFGATANFGITQPSPGVFWIGIPTFQHAERDQLRKLIKAVKARQKEMRNARAIVIDTRGNFGGTTIWANQLAEAIFTPKVLKAAQRNRDQQIAAELRASPENITYLREFVAGLQGSDVKQDRRSFNSTLKSIERAAQHAQPLARIGSSKTSHAGGITAQRPQDAESPFPASVYFLSNGTCSSTCLIFADKVLMVPGVRLVGSATSGDTPYGEVRSEKLPSGLTELVLPQSVMRGRGRGALEAYQPDVAYEGSWDDTSVRAWVLSLTASTYR